MRNSSRDMGQFFRVVFMVCLAGVFLTGPLFETLAGAQGGLVVIPRVVGQPLAAA